MREAPRYPRRIVALTEETTETLYRLGLGDVVVGISSWTVRPPEALTKPRVSSFLDANFEKILALKPDLVVGFSDLQADIARELGKRGIPVWLQNQRSVSEILQNIRVLAAVAGAAAAGESLASELEQHLRDVAARASARQRRPRVFFEEWPDPLISGIRWVSELIEIAGGADVCVESRARHDAAGRSYAVDDVRARKPDVIIASWCGKPVDKPAIAARFPSVDARNIHELPSAIILQPGPAALTDGVDALARIIEAS